MFEQLKHRWQAAETNIGSIFKYYIGYIGMASGFISAALTDITAQYAAFGISVPLWITKTLLYVGIAGYAAGKLTKKKETI